MVALTICDLSREVNIFNLPHTTDNGKKNTRDPSQTPLNLSTVRLWFSTFSIIYNRYVRTRDKKNTT